MDGYVIGALERPGEVTGATLDALMDVWESSVRATHLFLEEADIVNLRPLVRDGLNAVPLFAAMDAHGRIGGFAGVAGDMLEMLFVHARARGRGIGRALLVRAVDAGVTRLDVNEQNPDALGFYRHMGFEVVGRSPVDGQGRPFPLLHMSLSA